MEEAPTPKNEKQAEKEFQLNSDKNHPISIKIINLKSTIQITSLFKDDILNHIYQKEFSLEELRENNKYFLLYETIDEIYEDLILLMDKNQTKISEENNTIKINIPIESKKIKEISFILNEVKKGDKEMVQELYSLVCELKKEIKEIKEENKNLKSKVNILESYLPFLEEYKKKEIEKQIKNLDSLIINGNNNYNKTLKNWINPNLKIKAELLYRLSRDGEKYETFHKLCDNQGPTLVLTKLSDGDILGTYSPIDWDNKTENWKNDLGIFVFSLNRNMKASKKQPSNNYGIYCSKIYGPESYFLCFQPGKNMKLSELRIDNSEYSINTQDLVPNKKNDFYNAIEVEIFKIIFE